MIKAFSVTEQTRLQVFASFNNVLNHPRWNFPDANVFSTTFGVVGTADQRVPYHKLARHAQLLDDAAVCF